MTATSPNTNSLQRSPTVGERRELGRYSTPTDGERVLYGQRVKGVVRFLSDDLVVLVPGRARARTAVVVLAVVSQEEDARTLHDRNDPTSPTIGAARPRSAWRDGHERNFGTAMRSDRRPG
jgi:hypothetical protein